MLSLLNIFVKQSVIEKNTDQLLVGIEERGIE